MRYLICAVTQETSVSMIKQRIEFDSDLLIGMPLRFDQKGQIMAKSAQIPDFGLLHGVKVLSTGAVAAEPYAATLMAEHGADVIQVENARHPEDMRKSVALEWAQDARCKRTIALDIPSDEGREIFLALIRWADIWLESSKGGTYRKWDLDDDVILAQNPDLVIVHVSGYGEVGEPDYVCRPSYDPIAQAFSGFMYINSPAGTKPMAVFPGIGDFITALFALWSSLAALLHARETGEGEVVDLSQYEALLRVSAQYPAEYFTNGTQLVRNPDIDGDVGGLGVYECKDGRYVYVALNPSALKSEGLALLGLAEDPDFGQRGVVVAGTARDAKSKRAIEDYCSCHSASEVDRDFNQVNIGCCKIMDYSELGSNPHCLRRESIIEWFDDASGKMVRGVGVVPRVERRPGRVWRGAPRVGQDNEDILGELGYSSMDIEKLYAEGVIVRD